MILGLLNDCVVLVLILSCEIMLVIGMVYGVEKVFVLCGVLEGGLIGGLIIDVVIGVVLL